MKKSKITVSLVLSLAIAAASILTGCKEYRVYAEPLPAGKIDELPERSTDEEFIKAQISFAASLFKTENAANTEEKNLLLSPLSVMLVLSMVSNGADGETLAELETALGGIEIAKLNEYLSTYLKYHYTSDDCKVSIADSVWIKEGTSVLQDFVNKCASYYDSEVYNVQFDGKTLNDVNNWAAKHTDGLIDKILDKIGENDIMYLVNAILFDAKWEIKYEKSDIKDRTFTREDGTVEDIEMMFSGENRYIADDDGTVGFMKPYKGDKYAFTALLPAKGVKLSDYIASLDGEKLYSLLTGAKYGSVEVGIPEFKAEYGTKLNDTLREMGIVSAFDRVFANFSKMTGNNDLYLSYVLHKTCIEVDRNGTKAAAVTIGAMDSKCSAEPPETVYLDRPFVYMIVDLETNIPIFIGAEYGIH